jgi:hypothetical protein
MTKNEAAGIPRQTQAKRAPSGINKCIHRRNMKKKTLLYLTICLLITAVSIFQGTGAITANAEDTVSGHYMTINVNSGQVSSTLEDFPMLVSINNNSDLKTVANGGHVVNDDGSDIYFTDFSGSTVYAYEIESYDSSSGTLIAWIKIPSLSDDTGIRMYYGGNNVSGDASLVWSNGYQGVWHMTEANAEDSTANGNNGTANGDTEDAITNTGGKIGIAQDFLPGSTYIDCGNDSSLDFFINGTYTWEVWVNADEFHSGGSGIIGKEPGIGYIGYDVYLGGVGSSPPGRIRFQTSTGSSSDGMIDSTEGAAINGWTHIAIVYDNGSVYTYINGVLNVTGSVVTADDTSSSLYLGWKRNSPVNITLNAHLKGSIDEVEYSNVARSENWIITSYNNQNDPKSFYTVSEERDASLQSYKLEVTIKGNGKVSIYPDKPDYVSGTPVEITAIPDNGWSFAGWIGATSHSNKVSILMDSNKTIGASFTEWLKVAKILCVSAAALVIVFIIWNKKRQSKR